MNLQLEADETKSLSRPQVELQNPTVRVKASMWSETSETGRMEEWKQLYP